MASSTLSANLTTGRSDHKPQTPTKSLSGTGSALSQQQSPRNTSTGGAPSGTCVQWGPVEVTKALQDGEKFVKWDEVSFESNLLNNTITNNQQMWHHKNVLHFFFARNIPYHTITITANSWFKRTTLNKFIAMHKSVHMFQTVSEPVPFSLFHKYFLLENLNDYIKLYYYGYDYCYDMITYYQTISMRKHNMKREFLRSTCLPYVKGYCFFKGFR